MTVQGAAGSDHRPGLTLMPPNLRYALQCNLQTSLVCSAFELENMTNRRGLDGVQS